MSASGPDHIDLSLEEAFVLVLLAAVSADGHVSADESAEVFRTFRGMGLYRGWSTERLQAIVGQAMERIEYHGVAPMVARAARRLPRDLRETAFANAADLVLSDRRVAGHERHLLDELQVVLELAEERAAVILEVLRVKNRG